MTDSENDNLEDKDNLDEYDEKFKCYNYDNNEIYTLYLKSKERERVKIDKVEDYYDLFVDMLKLEDKKLHTKEHLWVLGIDETGYSACVYVIVVGYPNFFNVEPTRLFKTALQHNSIKIIIGQSKPDTDVSVRCKQKLTVTPTDLDLTNIVYHKAAILGLELVDHIVISNSSIYSKTPFYCSHLENGALYFVQNDMTYKSYKDIEPQIEKARKEYGVDQKIEGKQEGLIQGEKTGIDKRNIEIVKEMLSENYSVSAIMKITKLTLKEIEELKAEIEKGE